MSNSNSKNIYSFNYSWLRDIPKTKWLFTLFWIQYTVVYWSCVILNKIPFFIYLTPFVFPILFCATLFIFFRASNFKTDVSNIIVFFLAITFWYISRWIHPDYKMFFDMNAQVCLEAFFMLYVGKSLFLGGLEKDYFDSLIKLSKIGLILTSLYFVYGIFIGRIAAQEYMTISYRLLPSTLCITAALLINVKFKNIIWFGFATVLHLFMGTRGAVLSIIVFVLLYFILFLKRKYFYIVLICAGLSVLLDYLFNISRLLLLGLAKICGMLNMSTRIIDAILSSSLANDNGRNDIFEFVIERIRNNIWTGQGIFSDRYILQGLPGGGLYVHNIFIELWSDFGLVPALLILAVILFLFSKHVLNKQLPFEAKILLSIVFSAAMTQLMFTGSYLTDAPFWLFIGMIWGISRHEKELTQSICRINVY